MGFLNSRTDPDDERVRAYLADAPPGSRTEWLMRSGVVRVADTPIAAADQFGRPLTVAAVRPASELVREVMFQDRDLSGSLIRKAAFNLTRFVGGSMSGSFAADIDRALGGVGLVMRDGDPEFLPGAEDGGSAEDSAGAKALAGMVLGLMGLIETPVRERPSNGLWTLYRELFAAQPGEERETLAYDLTAWVDVVVARLLNAGGFSKAIPYLTDEFRTVPRLTEAGWWPNPNKHGEAVDGVSPLQRYWDGARWTDRIRIKSGRDWKVGSHSLHDPDE